MITGSRMVKDKLWICLSNEKQMGDPSCSLLSVEQNIAHDKLDLTRAANVGRPDDDVSETCTLMISTDQGLNSPE